MSASSGQPGNLQGVGYEVEPLGNTWTSELIDLLCSMHIPELKNYKASGKLAKEKHWSNIVNEFEKRGSTLSKVQIQTKFRKLKAGYKEVKDTQGRTLGGGCTFKHYEIMHTYYALISDGEDSDEEPPRRNLTRSQKQAKLETRSTSSVELPQDEEIEAEDNQHHGEPPRKMHRTELELLNTLINNDRRMNNALHSLLQTLVENDRRKTLAIERLANHFCGTEQD